MKICRIYDDIQSGELIYNGAGQPLTIQWSGDRKASKLDDDYEIPESLEDAKEFALSCLGCTGWDIEWYV